MLLSNGSFLSHMVFIYIRNRLSGVKLKVLIFSFAVYFILSKQYLLKALFGLVWFVLVDFIIQRAQAGQQPGDIFKSSLRDLSMRINALPMGTSTSTRVLNPGPSGQKTTSLPEPLRLLALVSNMGPRPKGKDNGTFNDL